MREIVATDKAPAAIGPYSQAIKCSGQTMLFCSGQIPLNPANGEIIGETAAEQCKQCMDNLGAVLKAAGGDYGHLVKITIFLADMNDFAAVNEVYGGYFKSEPPAREAVEVSRLPKDVRVEISGIATL